MKRLQSPVPFSYKTIKVTQSRIKKGLMAIPASLVRHFPSERTTIYVAAGIGAELLPKRFTPLASSSTAATSAVSRRARLVIGRLDPPCRAGA